jgi:hypothetical protein
MIKSLRENFNQHFSEAKYAYFLNDLNQAYNYKIPFRVAESPIFVGKDFTRKLKQASETIIDFITRPDLKKLTDRAIPSHLNVPNETDHTLFLALDFAIVKNTDNELEPQLIEMQGFPSLFGFQDFLSKKFCEHYPIPPTVSPFFELGAEEYQQKFKNAMLGDVPAENTILLEIDPLKQNTAIDFLITKKITGVEPVHIGDLQREGRDLFYWRDKKRVAIHRIYNRVIFDELIKRDDLKLNFNLTEDVNVQWAGHPNWFFRISKFTMPFIKSEFIPECKFLSDFDRFPSDLENYVLKPLFSFSGSGVIFHVTQNDIESISEKERGNFLLQRKVKYEPVIQAPDGNVKAELRLMFIWEQGKSRPTLVTNLARLSRGEMIGVKFNKDKTWVGGSVGFYEI